MKNEAHPPSLDKQGYPYDHAIAFCTDINFWPHVATAIKSLFFKSQLVLPDIYVFHEREDLHWMRKLTRLARAHKQTIRFQKFGLDLIQNVETNNRYGPASYFRIHLPNLLKKYNYILYLDSDLIATSDISSIFSYHHMGESCVAARSALKIELIYHNQRLGRPLDTQYFNSGVLLIDALRWRENKCTEAIMSILKNYPDLCIFPDQDAMNIFFQGKFQKLPYRYNVTRRFYEEQTEFNFPGEETLIKDAAKEPAIVHYSGSSKPWHLHDKHPLRQRYRMLRGSFHWYPYSFCISTAESIANLRIRSHKTIANFIHPCKKSIVTSIKKVFFHY